MKSEHESYEMIYNDIVLCTEKLSLYKLLKTEMTAAVGHGEVINEERMEKMEGYMVDSTLEVIQAMVDAIRAREKERKSLGRVSPLHKDNPQVMQILDNLMEIMQFSLSRQRYNKNVEQIIEEANNENYNVGNGSTPQIKYDDQGIRERKSSEEFKEAKEWGDARDSLGLVLVQKYERLMGMLSGENHGGSLGNIKL